ncbi:type II toxin-antitoxin system ParD family antitoxin [Brachybacterium timonense]|nr:type II toxin-antitoxin system ParD family antitoxin [Brachybacterium timonense]
MAQSISVTLDDHYARFVAEEVASGRYRPPPRPGLDRVLL